MLRSRIKLIAVAIVENCPVIRRGLDDGIIEGYTCNDHIFVPFLPGVMVHEVQKK